MTTYAPRGRKAAHLPSGHFGANGIMPGVEFEQALRILSALERHDVAYVLVGSMAMAAQGIVRATRDMDIFVRADEPNVARLRAALHDVFGDPDTDQISAADLAGEYPAVQYIP